MCISLSLIYALFKAWQNLTMKIVVSDESITIDKPFKTIDIKWDEILEFGKSRGLLFLNSPGYYGFFLKFNKPSNKKIELGALSFKDKDDLITTIFEKAHNARFVYLENTSWIP